MEATKIKVENVEISKVVLKTFYIPFHRNKGCEWFACGSVYECKDQAELAIEPLKEYDSFANSEFKLVSFDLDITI